MPPDARAAACMPLLFFADACFAAAAFAFFCRAFDDYYAMIRRQVALMADYFR
jgi:hypothetical protein